jgi:hypothetical protein
MHKCAAMCCENETYSVQKVYKCVETCSDPLNKAQRFVQKEFDRIQVCIHLKHEIQLKLKMEVMINLILF